MQKILLAGVAAIAFTSSAFAADLPSRKYAPPEPVYLPPPFTWTGFYVGVNAGYSFGSDNKTSLTGLEDGVNVGGRSFKTERDGFIGGAQAGYNYQIGQFVIGAETDIQYLDNKKTLSLSGFDTDGNIRSEGTYFGTVRARLGFTPTERLLIYGTGGLAYGDSKITGRAAGRSINDGMIGGADGGSFWSGKKSDTRAGYAVGAGVEYAFTPNWTAKIEYLYYDLGKTTMNMAGYGEAAGTSLAIKSENKGNIVRAGLNYKF